MIKLEKKTDKAILTIYGYVGGYYLSTENIQNALDEIKTAGYRNIDFHLHTYGGYVFDGNLIYNFLAGFDGEIDIYIDGVAASMGSIIMMAGTRTYIAENGFIMIHLPSGGAIGNAKDFESYAKLLRSMENNFRKKLIERTGKSEAEVNAWLDGTDHWFDAEQALDAGLVDGQVDAKTKEIVSLSTDEASDMGAQAVFERFAALTNESQIPKQKKMDKKQIIAKYNLQGVTDESTDAEVMAALDAKMAEGDKAKEDAQALVKKSIEQSVDAAIASKKINKEKRDEYIARGEKLGLEELNGIFADMNAYTPVSGSIQGGGAQGSKGKEQERKDWKWEDYQEKAAADLEKMPKQDPEKFKSLYKEQFGVEPEL